MKFSTKFVAATREFATFEKPIPAPCFRKEFTLGKASAASLTICGLGFYDLFINGQRITRGLLSSYIANPDDILYYDSYDLVPYLREGSNVIGVVLGNGMLNCFGGQIWDFEKARYRSAPKLALTLEAETDEGLVEFDAASGFVCTESPIYLDDIRIGEFYDATRELGDWTLPGYDAGSWREPISAETPRGVCRLCDADPIVATKELSPVDIFPGKIAMLPKLRQREFADLTPELLNQFPAGEENVEGFIYDFGLNGAGLCRLHIRDAVPGQKIVIQFGEKLVEGEDGKLGLDMRGMTFLPYRYDHRDIYICKGGDETYMPTFTYHGFRYALVTGISEKQATKDLLTYVVMNTDLQPRTTFSCSDEMTNKLWDAVITADLANFYHFPTDCPHREKNGWTGDAALSAEQMVMALTPERNFREWLHNIRAAMNEAGAIPGIVPTAGWGMAWGNGPAWDIVLVNLPYYTWLYRGDTQILRENATAIFRYIQYITTRRDENGLIHIGLGDWCAAGRRNVPQAPLEFTDTVICMDICKKASKIYEVLGMAAQRQFAETVWQELRDAARVHLIDTASMTALGRCQTTQAMAIYYDVFDNGEKPAAFRMLLTLIEKENGSFDCGILGLRVLFHVLSAYGRSDLAFRMITKTEYPSYGYQIAHGATTLWESFAREEASPSSRNHHFFGDIISWFVQNLAGLRVNPYQRDPNEIQFRPRFIEALDHAEAAYAAPAGTASISWKRDEAGILVQLTVPAGVKGELIVDEGWQTETGMGHVRVGSSCQIRLIPDDQLDTNSYSRD